MGKEWVSHKRYAKISLQKRKKLIQMVTQLNKSIVQTAKQLKVKLSTAKLILKKYKETGTLFDKKMPDYCRRKKKQPEQPQKTEKQVKIEGEEKEPFLASRPAAQEVSGEGEAGRAGEGCKKQQIVPTMLYLYYYP